MEELLKLEYELTKELEYYQSKYDETKNILNGIKQKLNTYRDTSRCIYASNLHVGDVIIDLGKIVHITHAMYPNDTRQKIFISYVNDGLTYNKTYIETDIVIVMKNDNNK
jgi:hypothetical protein